MRTIADTFSSPWQRCLLLMFAGVAAAAALPPLFIWPLGVGAFIVLYVGVKHTHTKRGAFGVGWAWGFGYFLAGLYWIMHALLTDAEQFGWLIPFALTLIPAVLALYIGLSCVAFRMLGGHGWVGVLQFACMFSLFEWLRGQLFTGFPWNLAGSMLNITAETLQVASLVGAYGMSVMVVFIATLPVLMMRKSTLSSIPLLGFVLLIGAIYGYGYWRIQQLHTLIEPTDESPQLRLVQANIMQHHKWDPEIRTRAVEQHIAMSLSQPLDGIDAVIWPETALPFFVEPDSPLTEKIAKAVPPGGVLISGGLRIEPISDNTGRFYNALFAFGAGGAIESYYDKRHLVPFGEYVPLRAYLPITKITAGSQDFSSGVGEHVLTAGVLPPFRPLICYEAIFPDELMLGGEVRAQWLLNITNDAWFGRSTGPYQHLEMARTRAVESGLPMVRVANTGVSAIIDPLGRMQATIELETEGVVDAALPNALPGTPIAARTGGLFFPLIIGLILVISLIFEKKRQK